MVPLLCPLFGGSPLDSVYIGEGELATEGLKRGEMEEEGGRGGGRGCRIRFASSVGTGGLATESCNMVLWPATLGATVFSTFIYCTVNIDTTRVENDEHAYTKGSRQVILANLLGRTIDKTLQNAVWSLPTKPSQLDIYKLPTQ